MEQSYYLMLSAVLFTIGVLGFLTRRNPLVLFMSIELMLNAANLALITFANARGDLGGQVMAFFVMIVAAAEVVVGLAIIITIVRSGHTTNIDASSWIRR